MTKANIYGLYDLEDVSKREVFVFFYFCRGFKFFLYFFANLQHEIKQIHRKLIKQAIKWGSLPKEEGKKKLSFFITKANLAESAFKISHMEKNFCENLLNFASLKPY